MDLGLGVTKTNEMKISKKKRTTEERKTMAELEFLIFFFKLLRTKLMFLSNRVIVVHPTY